MTDSRKTTIDVAAQRSHPLENGREHKPGDSSLEKAVVGWFPLNWLRHPRRASAVVIGLVVVVGIGWLWWQAATNPTIYYLPQHARAEWIVYPRPYWLAPHAAVPLDASFQKTFFVDEVPRSAEIEYRAFGTAEITINGRPVEASGPRSRSEDQATNASDFLVMKYGAAPPPSTSTRNWKQAERSLVEGWLRPGENTIRIVVINDVGPPALWLRLVGDHLSIATGTDWQVRLAGSAPRRAQSVAHPPPQRHLGIERLYKIETLTAARWARKPLGIAAAIGLLVACAVGLWPSHRHEQTPPAPSAASSGEGAFRTPVGRLFQAPASQMWGWWAVVSVVWFAMVVHNQPWLTANMGFDAVDHLEYIEFIQHHHSLPLAEDGREMHQPPLFYAVAAGWLSLFGETPTSQRGLSLLRLLTGALGAMHFGFAAASLRLLFPQKRNLAVLGMLFAAALPMHLYIFQYISNESMTAVLSASVVYVALRMLASDHFSLVAGALLGLLLGGALLSKITTLVLPPVVLTVMAARLIVQRRFVFRDWLAAVGLPLVVCTAVSGWQYYRNWQHYGTPLVRHIDLPDSAGGVTWKDPGLRQFGDFVRFGRVLKRPFLAGFRSFPDAMYSTFWGDGRCGGRGGSGVRPAWNYNLMAAGYLLAIVPAMLLAVGLLLATVRLLQSPTATWYLLVGLLFSMVFALTYETLKHPYLTVTKAWYGIPATTALIALLALAADVLTAHARWRQSVLWGLLAMWMMVSVFSFWIPANRSRAWYSLGVAYADQKNDRRASECFSRAIKANPHNARAVWLLGRMVARSGNVQKALTLMAHAMRLDPDLGGCALDMAVLLRRAGRAEKARQYARKATQLAPHEPEAHRLLGDLLALAGKPKEAVEALVRAIPLRPTDARIYFRLAKLYDIAGQGRAAIRNAQRAVWMSRGAANMRAQYAGLLIKYGHVSQGVEEYERILDDEPENATAAAGLAWFLVAYPDVTRRNGQRAIELAQSATKQDPENVIYWRTLAVAYAEAGRFDEALAVTQHARELVKQHGWPKRYEELLRQDIARYRRQEKLPLNGQFSLDAQSSPASP